MPDQLKNKKGLFTNTPRVAYESGDVYGFLTLTGKCFMKPYAGQDRRFVEVICKCGKIYFTNFQSLRAGSVVSCGCFQKSQILKANLKHGLSKRGSNHPLSLTWGAIKSRCYNTKDIAFPNYGGRRIEVCDEWKNNLNAFYEWAILNGWNEDLSIDRIDVNGNYAPSNCRWATSYQQSRNKRNNHWVTAFGETKILTDWVKDERCKVGYGTLNYRLINKKWHPEDALTILPITKNR